MMVHILPGREYVVPTSEDGRIKAVFTGVHLHGQPSDAVECAVCGALSKNYMTFEAKDGRIINVGISCADLVGRWTDAMSER